MIKAFKPPFHQSDIEKYNDCPMKFYFLRILEIAPETLNLKAFLGIVMHEALHRIHKMGGLPDKLDEWLYGLIDHCEHETEQGTRGYSPSKVAWKDRGKEIEKWIPDSVLVLENYWKDSRNRDAEILLSEAEFTVDIAGFEFSGRIDQLRRNPDGTVILIDFKTGDTQYSDIMMELDFQLSIYAYAMKSGLFKYPHLDCLIPNVDFVGIYHTKLHLPYKRKSTKDGVTYQAGDQRPGEILRLTTRTENDFRIMIEDLANKCRQIMGPTYDPFKKHLRKGGCFTRSPQNIMGCATCPVKHECIAMKNQKDNDVSKIENLIQEEDFKNV